MGVSYANCKNIQQETKYYTQHEISNLRMGKDVKKNTLRSSLCVFTNLFTLSERMSSERTSSGLETNGSQLATD